MSDGIDVGRVRAGDRVRFRPESWADHDNELCGTWATVYAVLDPEFVRGGGHYVVLCGMGGGFGGSVFDHHMPAESVPGKWLTDAELLAEVARRGLFTPKPPEGGNHE